jgi:Flp pilus assembly protein TadG
MTRARRDERGGAALEFALVAPVLFALLFGILQYGYHYWAIETASATAREAARRFAVGTELTCTQNEAIAHADSAALGPVTVSRTPVSPKVGDLVTVTVSFQSLDMHLFPVPDDGWISQTDTARVETVPAVALTC